MNHYRKTMKLYRNRQRSEGCPFCSEQTQQQAISETQHGYIVPNLTKYDLWELYEVTEHLLLVPKRHVKSLNELTAAERTDLMDCMCDYESRGYSIYARGVGFVKRSVEHQHTHLIKTTNRTPRASIFIQHPYFLFKV